MPAALPPDFPLRQVLNDEVHARPPAPLSTPEHIGFLAILTPPEAAPAELAALRELLAHHGQSSPLAETSHLLLELPGYRLRWERHTEFSTYTVFRPGSSEAGPEAFAALPAGWLAKLPGQTLVAAEVSLRAAHDHEPERAPFAEFFGHEDIIGASVVDGAGAVFTDFRLTAAGHSRFLVLDHRLSRKQAGRVVQRLLEIETYRMMALLAFPVARAAHQVLSEAERELARITAALASATPEEEAGLLQALTQVAAAMERRVAETRFRFSAAQAYYELVRRRIGELREARLPGVQTLGEFMERRLAPAMFTCATAQRRQEELSAHIARAGQLLRTRVDVATEQQNQRILASMDRRAHLQLRLQETVEGLSVAAITYYTVGLIGYLGKSLKAVGWNLDTDLLTGASIPVVALGVALGVRQIRKAVKRQFVRV